MGNVLYSTEKPVESTSSDLVDRIDKLLHNEVHKYLLCEIHGTEMSDNPFDNRLDDARLCQHRDRRMPCAMRRLFNTRFFISGQ